jgi:hypothetical protein
MSSSGVVLWIPGPWQDRSEFLRAVALGNKHGVLAAGSMMFDAEKRRHASFEVLAPGKRLADEMHIGSGRVFDEAMLGAIEDHASIACIAIKDTGPGLDDRLSVFSSAVRAAGGLAVKVVRSGLSHDWARWEAELKSEMPAGLFRLLVVQVPLRDEHRLSSFGMAQFGLADASIEDDGSDVGPAWALFEFNIYLWSQRPSLKAGDTFSRNEENAISYRLGHTADRRYPEGHAYFNPHGVWQLQRA